jgi:FKBP-type peptidyl-prolyl cis-trans isomerase
VPQSRHRKVDRARKRPKGSYTVSSRPSPTKSHASNKNRQVRVIAIAAVAVITLVAVAYVIAHRARTGNEITTASGLKYTDIVEGTGENPKAGQTVVVHYTGTLENGKKFDSSLDRGKPAEFQIGVGKVIKGWDEGLMTMKVGGKRKLVVPSAIGYGASGRPPDIPPNSTLVFEVELLGLK